MVEPRKSAVVTGASTGIGRAIAERLTAAGWQVFGGMRKQEDADAGRAALGDAFVPLLFDVTDRAGIETAAQKVSEALNDRTLDGLVNNAGVATPGPLAYVPADDLHRQFDVNLYGAVSVTQAFLPLLGTDPTRQGPRGRIVNMSSVAGKIASPFLGPYAMSKHALEAFSHSLRRELLIHGIDVIIIGPGAVRTPIWAKADDMNLSAYQNTEYADLLDSVKNMMQEYGGAGLPAEDVGDLVVRALTKKKPKTRYAIMRGKFFNWTIPRLLPDRVIDKALAKRFGVKARGRP